MNVRLAVCAALGLIPFTAGIANTFLPGGACPGDTRSPVAQAGLPWRCVGKLSLPDHRFMTATLVGPNLILTAAHGLVRDGRLRPGRFTFHPDFGGQTGRNQASAIALRCWLGSFTPQRDDCRHADWAIVQLDRNLGDTCGTLPVADVDAARLAQDGRSACLVSYSRDFRSGNAPCWQAGGSFCALDANGYLLHDFSTANGASGAPIFFQGRSALDPDASIVALNVAEKAPGNETLFRVPFTPAVANVAIAGHEFFPTLQRLLADPTLRAKR